MAFEKYKTEKNTNYYWDVTLESKDGTEFTGILIEDISVRDKKPALEMLIDEQMNAAKKWAGEEFFITEFYEMNITFKAFTYIATSPSNPEEAYFGMNAIRIEGNYAIMISVTVNSTDKKAFNDVMKIYIAE